MACHDYAEHSFYESCHNAPDFPCNLLQSGIYQHAQEAYLDHLDAEAPKIFCIDSKTAVEFLELEEQDGAFNATCIYTHEDLNRQLRWEENAGDPVCRYIFIGAPHARARLKADRITFMRILSYHQVMPSFLDFVLSFGEQHRAKDFQFCGFRGASHLTDDERLQSIPSLRRSGRTVNMCYSMRSVEPTHQEHTPWSIRQCAVYHSYDADSDRATWIVVKANKLINNRVRASIDSNMLYGRSESEVESRSFVSTLKTHLLMASWSAEQWRWYVNYLEDRLELISGRVINESMDTASIRKDISASRNQHDNQDGQGEKIEQHSSLSQLQDVHFLEEKTAEALLVTEGNANVIRSLETFYGEVLETFADERRPEDGRVRDLRWFCRELDLVQKELMMHQRRLRTLEGLLHGRKSLLRNMLQHRSVIMNRLLAEDTQKSADNMESMTKEMRALALKTKLETVSMRIITFVTLIYLPGTFVSTLMSTPIVTFEPADFSLVRRNIDFDALKLFLAMSIPLLLFTVAMWWFFMFRENNKNGGAGARTAQP